MLLERYVRDLAAMLASDVYWRCNPSEQIQSVEEYSGWVSVSSPRNAELQTRPARAYGDGIVAGTGGLESALSIPFATAVAT